MKELKERLSKDREAREADRNFTIDQETPLSNMKVVNKAAADSEGAATDESAAAPSA